MGMGGGREGTNKTWKIIKENRTNTLLTPFEPPFPSPPIPKNSLPPPPPPKIPSTEHRKVVFCVCVCVERGYTEAWS